MRCARKPFPQPHQVEGRSARQMLQMSLCEPDIARLPEATPTDGEHGDAGGNFKTPIKMTCAIHSSLAPEKPCYARHTATRYLSRCRSRRDRHRCHHPQQEQPTHRASRVVSGRVQTPPRRPPATLTPTASHHLSRHPFDLPGLRDTPQAQGPRQQIVSQLVWHLYVLQSEAGTL